MMTPQSVPASEENIQLDYSMHIHVLGDNLDFMTDGAEVFKDEHGFQWIKFYPISDRHPHRQHLIRTDLVYIVTIPQGANLNV